MQYIVTQEQQDRFDGSISQTKRVIVRSYLRAKAVSNRWVGKVTRDYNRATQWAYINGVEQPSKVVPSVGELGYW